MSVYLENYNSSSIGNENVLLSLLLLLLLLFFFLFGWWVGGRVCTSLVGW